MQATKTFAKAKEVIQAALAKVEEVVQGAVKIIARLTYRQRYEQSTGRDPFRCPHGQHEMELWCIWHPTYGVIYDEGEVIKRGTYASTSRSLIKGLMLKSPPVGRFVHGTEEWATGVGSLETGPLRITVCALIPLGSHCFSRLSSNLSFSSPSPYPGAASALPHAAYRPRHG